MVERSLLAFLLWTGCFCAALDCGNYTHDTLAIWDIFTGVNVSSINDWNSSCNVCDWMDFDCNGDNVTDIHLGASGLEGELNQGKIHWPANLISLDLQNNFLWGEFPLELLPTTLGELDISDNAFYGSMNFSVLGANLFFFDVSHNDFSGSMNWPDGIWGAVFVQTFDVRHNQFSGTVPWHNMANFLNLWLSHNNFSGHVSWKWFNQTTVISLVMEGNAFDGAVDIHKEDFTSVANIFLNGNKFTGPITWSNLPSSLQLLQLGNNSFNGVLNLSDFNNADLEYGIALHVQDNMYDSVIFNGTNSSSFDVEIFLEESVVCNEAVYCEDGSMARSRSQDHDTCFVRLENSADIKQLCDETCRCLPPTISPTSVTHTPTIGPTTGSPTAPPTKTDYDLFSSTEKLSSGGGGSSLSDNIISFVLILMYCVIGVCSVVFVISAIQTRCAQTRCCMACFSPVDDSNIFAPMLFGFQMWDFITDIAFAYTLYDRAQRKKKYNDNALERYLVLFYLSLVFIIIPWTLNLTFFFIRARAWKNHSRAQSWLRTYAWFLMFCTMLTGGANASLELFNSRLFMLNIFDMGLAKRELVGVSRWRVLLITVCENIPQLVIQIIFLTMKSERDQISEIAILAMMSSVISILLMFGTWMTRLSDPLNDKLFHISCQYDITSSPVSPKELRYTKYHVTGMRRKLGRHIADACGLDIHQVTVEYTQHLIDHCECWVAFNTYERSVAQLQLLLEQSKDGGSLQYAFSHSFRLKGSPRILKIQPIDTNDLSQRTYSTIMSQHSLKQLEGIPDGSPTGTMQVIMGTPTHTGLHTALHTAHGITSPSGTITMSEMPVGTSVSYKQ